MRLSGCLLEQGNLLEETRLLDQLRLLSQIAQAAAGNLDLARILTVSLTELDRNLPLHGAAVWLVEEEARPEPGEAEGGPGTAVYLSPALRALHAHEARSQPRTPPQGVDPESREGPALVVADRSACYRGRAHSR